MFTRVILTIVCTFFYYSADAQAETLVDWLDARNHPSTPKARAGYWARFAPDVKYVRSAKQNTALLNALKIDAATPTLELQAALVSPGDDVKATIRRGEGGSTSLGVESNLRTQSFEAKHESTVVLGQAAKGVFAIRVIDKKFVRELFVVLVPGLDGKLSVLLTGDARKFATEAAAANPVTRPAGFGEAVRKLKATLNSERWKKSFSGGTVPFIAENVSSIGGSFVICSLAVATEGALAKECAVSVTKNGLSYGATVFSTYVDLAKNDTSIPDADRLKSEEAEMLKTAVNSLKLVAELGFSIKATDKTKLCKGLSLLGNVASFAAAEIDHSSGRMVATIFVDQSNKIVTIFCGGIQ